MSPGLWIRIVLMRIRIRGGGGGEVRPCPWTLSITTCSQGGGIPLLLHAHKGEASLWGELPQTGKHNIHAPELCLLLHAHKGQASLWGELPQTVKHNIHAPEAGRAGIPLGIISTDRLVQYSCFSLSCVYYFMLTRGRHPFGENFHRQVSRIFMVLSMSYVYNY